MKKLALLVVLAVLASQATMAQNLNLHRFDFSNTLETLSIEDALGVDSELAQRKFLLRLSYDYVQDPTIGNDNGRNIYPKVVRDMHSYQLGFGAMVSKKFFIGANIPMHRTEVYGSNAESSLGDISVQAKWRLTADNAGVNLALVPFISLPTGEKNEFITEDEVGFGLKVAADKTFGKIKLFANLGYKHNDDAYTAPGSGNVDRTNVATGAFGIFYKVNSWLGFNTEYERELNLDGGSFKNFQAVKLAARVTAKNIHFFVGSGIESVRGFENQDFNIYGGAKFAFGKVGKCGASCKKPAPAKKVNKVAALTKELSIERSIKFKTGSSQIKSSSFRDLDTAAASIVKYQDQIGAITVEGHTDSSGRAANNKKLSQKRADAVKAYLVSKGVNADKVNAIGYGEERLKVTEASAADRATNRRVEFKVSGKIEVK